MLFKRRTQKQISQRLADNLQYLRRPHYWRRLRFWTIFIVSIGGTAAMAWFYFSGSPAMYNPGPISREHARFAGDCEKCHEPADKKLEKAALRLNNQGIDPRCAACHPGRDFHEPDVVNARACTVCHQEHQGAGPMAPPETAQCIHCHGDTNRMLAFATAGSAIEPARFDFRPRAGWNVVSAPRPPGGFTEKITSFEGDHPEFRVLAQKLPDPDTLKFNHHRHLVQTNDIPLVNNKRIDCLFCHEPGPRGAFFQRVRFEQHCRVCHSLQVDEENRDLTLPHGRAEHVRAFLRSLPLQYADLARRQGRESKADVDAFVSTNMARLSKQFINGTNLERQVFFAGFRRGPDGRTKFDGCAGCHDARADRDIPAITPPVQSDRWMLRAHFNHQKHATVDCLKCHNAPASTLTTDVIMPAKKTCAECHSAVGKVSNDCAFCHTYHTPQRPQSIALQTRN